MLVGQLPSTLLSVDVTLKKGVYRLFGLTLATPWSIPGVPRSDPSEVDVEIVRSDDPLSDGFQDSSSPIPDAAPTCMPRGDGSVSINWPGLSEIAVSRDGRRVVAFKAPKTPLAAFQSYSLIQALSFSLIRQGLEPLHATTIGIADGAIALMGDCGYGKSTLAAAFVKRGHMLLSDDLLVTEFDDGEVVSYPGTGRLKLDPDVARKVLGKYAQGEMLAPVASKMAITFDAARQIPQRPLLKAVYVLGAPGESGAVDHVRIERLCGRDTVVQLLKNTYNDVIRGDQRLSAQFIHAAGLAERIPAKLVTYPRSLERLGEVYDAIVADLRS